VMKTYCVFDDGGGGIFFKKKHFVAKQTRERGEATR